MHERARAVLAFWFGTEFEYLGAFGPVPPEKMKIWYGGGPALDQVGRRKLIGLQRHHLLACLPHPSLAGFRVVQSPLECVIPSGSGVI